MIKPFRIDIPQSALDDLAAKLEHPATGTAAR